MGSECFENCNFLALLRDPSHVIFLKKYIEIKSRSLQVIEGHLNNKELIKKIKKINPDSSIDTIIISSEINGYKTKELPSFLKSLRRIFNNTPVMLLHPSRLAETDRLAINKALGENFHVLQGHDLEFDPISDIDRILKLCCQ